MKEMMERLKIDVIISAAVCIGLGIVLILWPIEVTMVVCKTIGAVIAFTGAVRIAGYIFQKEEKHSLHLLFGLVLLLVGVWIFLRPDSIQSIWFIGIGAVLFVHGLEDFKYAVEAKRNGYESWAILILMSLIGMIFGIVCIIDCFGVISITLSFVGIVLIYDGITDIWIISRVARAVKQAEKEVMERQKDLDAADADIIIEESGPYKEQDE